MLCLLYAYYKIMLIMHSKDIHVRTFKHVKKIFYDKVYSFAQSHPILLILVPIDSTRRVASK